METKQKAKPKIVAITDNDKGYDGLFIMDGAFAQEQPTQEQAAREAKEAEYKAELRKKNPELYAFLFP